MSDKPHNPTPSRTVGGAPAANAHGKRRQGPLVIASIVLALLVLHQDIWFWNSRYLVFGIVPIALFYHACISIAASATWLLATKIAWPAEIIEQAKAATGDVPSGEGVDR
jgi:hypothetical protein